MVAYNFHKARHPLETMTVPAIDESPAKYIVRHGAMRILGEFAALAGAAFARGDRVIVRTDRGQELGDVLCPATPEAGSHLPDPSHGDLLRHLTDPDRPPEAQLKEKSRTQCHTALPLLARTQP